MIDKLWEAHNRPRALSVTLGYRKPRVPRLVSTQPLEIAILFCDECCDKCEQIADGKSQVEAISPRGCCWKSTLWEKSHLWQGRSCPSNMKPSF